MFSYAAFGLALRSNVPIPGLLPGSTQPHAGVDPVVSVVLGSLPPSAPDESSTVPVFASDGPLGAPALRVHQTAGRVFFQYGDGTRFVLDRDGTGVWGTWAADLTLEDTATYLLGPIMAFVLKLRGRLALHAGVFELGEGAVALAGGPEAGKSTLLAALARRGTRVLTDDVAPIVAEGDRLLVQPTYPRVRLWPDAVGRLFGSDAALPLLTPNWDKRYLDLSEMGLFHDEPLPLRAILVLDERVGSDDAPYVRRLSPRAGLLSILAHLHSMWMQPKHPEPWAFELASRIAASVPIWCLVPHRDAARLGALCDAVVAAVAGIPVLDPPGGRSDVPAV